MRARLTPSRSLGLGLSLFGALWQAGPANAAASATPSAAVSPAAATPTAIAPAAESPAGRLPKGPPAVGLFALILGVNRSPDRDQTPLRYADDDAARYLDLFQTLGARTTLLSTFDENTRALHPQAAAEAKPASQEQVRQSVALFARDIRQARASGKRTVFYVIYAGHGDNDDDQPALTLEDGSLDADHLLSEVVSPTGADETHVIIDACHAYLFALPRGPGGSRRPVEGFVDRVSRQGQGELGGQVGFLLASSSTGDSHEWAGFEAGVFSHEVRSGLYGAADADGDGIVTYTEMAAFVRRANASIVAEKFRPQIIARPPSNGGTLLDLRRHQRDLRFEGKAAVGHFLLEDAQGVRLADFHASGVVPVQLVRPAQGRLQGPLYVRQLPGGEERAVPATTGLVSVLDLPVEPPRDRPRGAAAHAFAQTFTLPFDETTVVAYEETTRLELKQLAAEAEAARVRRLHTAGAVAFGVSAVALVVAGSFALAAESARDGAESSNNDRADKANALIRTRNQWAEGALIGAGVSALVGSYLYWRF